jgi:putative hydrolase of the HAD superfamily
MKQNIEAIFLDVGNTLRILVKDEVHQSRARKEIASLLGTDEYPDLFCQELDRRYKVYRKWAFENMVEASEVELWTRWLAPEFPAEKVTSKALELTYQFRQSMGRRVMAEDGKQVIEELYNRGYILGIISNVITSQEIPDWLEEDGLSKYFNSVVLSSVSGKRKPDPAIYHEAAAIAGIEPARCAYVGDNPKRDVVGTREAGFGMVIIMPDADAKDGPVTEENKPDLIIKKLADLLNYFPPR